VYDVPLASPPTMAVSGAGDPLTVTTWATIDPLYTLTA
jgi:hypothetical protein